MRNSSRTYTKRRIGFQLGGKKLNILQKLQNLHQVIKETPG
jgi:hypothetical protein